eukprot:1141539-Pelagomonas_calceolata.AAC.2
MGFKVRLQELMLICPARHPQLVRKSTNCYSNFTMQVCMLYGHYSRSWVQFAAPLPVFPVVHSFSACGTDF